MSEPPTTVFGCAYEVARASSAKMGGMSKLTDGATTVFGCAYEVVRASSAKIGGSDPSESSVPEAPA
jgi:hypothetical protein